MPPIRPDLDEFLRECQNWCNVAGLAMTTLSKHMMGRGGTLGEVADGRRKLTQTSVGKKRRWMRENPPETFREKHPLGRPRTRKKE